MNPVTTPASHNHDAFACVPTSRSTRLVIGNWKMHGRLQENEALLAQISQEFSKTSGVTLAVCVPFPYLSQARELLKGGEISWGSQDVSAHEKGAYTGEVAPDMLADFECRWTLVGHSERRSLHGESDDLVAQKALAALRGGITPVVCVGESLQERDGGQVDEVIKRQLQPILALGAQAITRLVVAYEPVWAIGTGHSATPQQAQDVHALIRRLLGEQGRDVPLLYGGSVKPENVGELFTMEDIDGALVGGASLVATDFVAIARQGAR